MTNTIDKKGLCQGTCVVFHHLSCSNSAGMPKRPLIGHNILSDNRTLHKIYLQLCKGKNYAVMNKLVFRLFFYSISNKY